MVNSCLKCDGNGQDKDVILFRVTFEGKSIQWQREYLQRLGIEEFINKDIYLCQEHLSPEVFEIRNSTDELNDESIAIQNEEFGDEQEIFYTTDDMVEADEDPLSDNSEAKDLVPLAPLVEYMNVYEEARKETHRSSDMRCKSEEDEVQTATDNLIESEYGMDNNSTQEIAVVDSETSSLEIEPVMPFFLSSAPMFTIVNENNEVGETIILQIEEGEEKKPPAPSKENIEGLLRSLCKSGGSIASTYACDICSSSYGCLNCLKSHYETLHIYNAFRRYKCRSANHLSKSTVCPVCELTFDTRSETVDHYVTHSVACDMCGSGFDRPAHLTEHYKAAHNKWLQRDAYECELCKLAFQYPTLLTKHYRTFHMMALCHVCKARFGTAAEVQDHEKVHQEKIDILPYACSKCDKAFPRISDIAVHIREEHKRLGVDMMDLVDSRPQKTNHGESAPVRKKVKVKK